MAKVYMALLMISILLACTACEQKKAPTPTSPGQGKVVVKGQSEAEISEDQSGEGLTKEGKFWVKYEPVTNPVPFQSLFAMKLTVLDPKDKKTPVQGVVVDQVDAVMPSHKHGMKVAPQVESVGPGQFLIQGMRFHMRGDGDDGLWVLEAVLRKGEDVDQTEFRIQCCKK